MQSQGLTSHEHRVIRRQTKKNKERSPIQDTKTKEGQEEDQIIVDHDPKIWNKGTSDKTSC